jgi:hypothetical protein
MLLEANPPSQSYWKKSDGQMIGALIAGAANAVLAIWYLNANHKDNAAAAPIVVLSVLQSSGLFFIGLRINIGGKKS